MTRVVRMYAAQAMVTKTMLDDAAFDIRTHIAERLRNQIVTATATADAEWLPNTWRLESQPFAETHEETARGIRRVLQRLKIVKPRSYVMEGEVFRASVQVWEAA